MSDVALDRLLSGTDVLLDRFVDISGTPKITAISAPQDGAALTLTCTAADASGNSVYITQNGNVIQVPITSEGTTQIKTVPLSAETIFGANQVGYGSLASPNAASEIKNLNMRVIRFAFQFDDTTSPNSSTIFWSSVDGVLAAAVANGLKVVLVVNGTPTWLSGNSNPFYIPVSGSTLNAGYLSQWTTFLTTLATRYQNSTVLLGIQIWNEPNTNYAGSFWNENGSTSSTPQLDVYRQMFNASYAAIKAVNSNLRVGIAGLAALTFWSGSGAIVGVTYLTSMITASGGNAFTKPDFVAIHPYTGGSPTANPTVDNYPSGNSFPDIGRIQTVMVSNTWGDLPLWVTEFGNYNASTITGGETTKAGYLTAAFGLINSTYGVSVIPLNQAAVTVCCYFLLNNSNSGGVDTAQNGLYTGAPNTGPNTILASGTTVKNYLASNPSNPVGITTGLYLTQPTGIYFQNASGVQSNVLNTSILSKPNESAAEISQQFLGSSTSRISSVISGTDISIFNEIRFRYPRGTGVAITDLTMQPQGDLNVIAAMGGVDAAIQDGTGLSPYVPQSFVDPTTTAIVAEVRGLSQTAADTLERSLGFVTSLVGYTQSTIYAANTIAVQFPVAGFVLTTGGTIELTLSLGANGVLAPILTGVSQSVADNLRTSAGLIGIDSRYIDGLNSGLVLNQAINPGTIMQIGDRLDFVYSSNLEPNVVGQLIQAGSAVLTAANLTVNPTVTQIASTRPIGTILSQSPVADSVVSPGDTVTLTTSSGPSGQTTYSGVSGPGVEKNLGFGLGFEIGNSGVSGSKVSSS